MTTTIVQPGQIERPAGDIPFVYIPLRNGIFHDRAERLRTLAESHSMKDYLLFVASVCDAQQDALNTFPAVPLPSETQLKLCQEHGMPPLSVQSWERDPAWREALRQICVGVEKHANPVAQEALARLQQMKSASLEVFANAVLSARYEKIDLAAAPFVAAALQVYWTHMATTLGAHAFSRNGIGNLCPACASSPVSSVVRIGGAEQGLRYLHCSLCETQWHMVRVKCSNCESTKGISYLSLKGTSGAVKAESCDECGSYLKIAYMDKDPHVDPIADDLATLALDLLMGDGGMLRSGPNPFLMTVPDAA